MFYFILVAVAAVALFLIFRDDHDRRYDQRSGSERQYLAEKPAPRPEPRTNARKTMEAEIAGLRYYCSLVDIGPIRGEVRAEPDNAHDPRAQAVVRADGKQLGYIPRAALDEFLPFHRPHHRGHVQPPLRHPPHHPARVLSFPLRRLHRLNDGIMFFFVFLNQG